MGNLKKRYDDIRKRYENVDIYRDTPVRLLGYANEVGEAFRAWVPRSVVRMSYVVASGYALADTVDKSRKTYRLGHSSRKELYKCVAMRAVDTAIWQALASVIIPGFTINRICYFAGRLLATRTLLPLAVRKVLSTASGLGAIPYIVKPIDTAVEFGMNHSLRKSYPKGII